MWPDWLSLNMFLFCSVLLFHPTHSLRLESWSFLVHSMTTSPSPSKPAQLQSYSKIWLGLTVPKPPTASDIVNSVCIFSAPNNWAGVSYLQSNSFLDSEANLFLSQGLGSSPAPFPPAGLHPCCWWPQRSGQFLLKGTGTTVQALTCGLQRALFLGTFTQQFPPIISPNLADLGKKFL